MILQVVPINMIAAPNFWSTSKDKFWQVTGGQAVDLWGMLTVVDSLGTRPYVPAPGSNLQILFQRGDYIGTVNNLQLSVTKTAAMDANFRAIVKFSLVSQEATNVTSGTVVFTLTEGVVVNKWAQNWAIRKLNVSAGF